MSRTHSLTLTLLLAACSSTPAVEEPVRESPVEARETTPLPPSAPARRDSLHDLGGGKALLVPAARIGDERINECSGLAYAGGYWWTHNDSGGAPVLYRSDSPWFQTAEAFEVPGAAAVDWEELAVLDGDILVCDIGDNARARDDLTIYRVRVTDAGLETVATYPVAYPDGRHDAEGVWVWDGRVHVVIKNRGEDETTVFRFDDLRDAAALPDGERNVATRVGSVNIAEREQVTAADSSADGLVVLLTYSQALFYAADDVSGDPIAAFALNARQCEAIAWTASGIVFANEQRDVYMVDDPLGCGLAWWLPPRPDVSLPRLPKGAADEMLEPLPIRNLKDGEFVRGGVVGGTLVIDVVLDLENDIVVSEGRLGTSIIVGFAADPGLQTTDADRMFAVVVPPDRPLGVVPFSMFGPPANQDLTGISVSGAGNDEVFTFRLEVDAGSVFPEGLPDRFLMQIVTNGFREGADEPLLSALDIWSLMRPFTWADVSVR